MQYFKPLLLVISLFLIIGFGCSSVLDEPIFEEEEIVIITPDLDPEPDIDPDATPTCTLPSHFLDNSSKFFYNFTAVMSDENNITGKKGKQLDLRLQHSSSEFVDITIASIYSNTTLDSLPIGTYYVNIDNSSGADCITESGLISCNKSKAKYFKTVIDTYNSQEDETSNKSKIVITKMDVQNKMFSGSYEMYVTSEGGTKKISGTFNNTCFSLKSDT